MADFKARLSELRAKKALEKQLNKATKSGAPNLNPSAKWAKKEKEVPPDVDELGVPAADALKLKRLIARHAELSAEISLLSKQKVELTEEAKPLCKLYEIEGPFMAGGRQASYYKVSKSSIKKELLMAQGVDMSVILKATVTTESWAFRTISKGGEDED